MAATPDGRGYWLVASDGGIFAFGDAGFYGSTGGLALNKPIVGMAATPDGGGYWLVASDGGIFAFGDAGFYGSTGCLTLDKPIVGMAATPDGGGYWLVASDGGIFAFGDAGFFGSTGGQHINAAITGMQASPTAQGYWLVSQDGGIFAFGDAHYYGSAGGLHLASPPSPSPTAGHLRPHVGGAQAGGGLPSRMRTTRAGTPTATHPGGRSWVHHGVGADDRPGPDRDPPGDRRLRPHPHVVADRDRGGGPALVEDGGRRPVEGVVVVADGHELAEQAVRADDHAGVRRHGAVVTEDRPVTHDQPARTLQREPVVQDAPVPEPDIGTTGDGEAGARADVAPGAEGDPRVHQPGDGQAEPAPDGAAQPVHGTEVGARHAVGGRGGRGLPRPVGSEVIAVPYREPPARTGNAGRSPDAELTR